MTLVCEVCGKEFEKKKQRGRPPKICYKCKEERIENPKPRASTNGEAKSSLTAVPILKPVDSPEEFHKGEVVYVLPQFVKDEINKRRFAKEYKIMGIDGQNVEVVRHAKTFHKKYPATVHFSRLMKKRGNEYLDINKEDVIMETEGND